MLLDLTAAGPQVGQVESQIQALYQIMTYALPLLGAFVIAAIAVYYRILAAVKTNSRSIQATVNLANGQLTAISGQLEEIHGHVQPSDSARPDAGVRPGSAADGSGTGHPPVPPTDAPVGIQSTPGGG